MAGATISAGGTIGGIVTSPTGVGAVAGAAVATAGAAVGVHGLSTAKNGLNNLMGNGRVNASSTNSSGGGRGKNHLAPDPDASGAHSTFKTDADGKVTKYAEYTPNSQNPTGFDEVKRVDANPASQPHVNKITKQPVPAPHVQGNNIPGGVRPATQQETPKSWWSILGF